MGDDTPPPGRTLAFQKDARDLAAALAVLLSELERHGEEEQDELLRGWLVGTADHLRPLVLEFEEAVVKERSRERAGLVLRRIDEIMERFYAACGRGELNLIRGRTMAEASSTYGRLRFIFRETKYSGLSL